MPGGSERQTRQRQAIRDAIVGAAAPLTTQEILHRAKSRVRGLGMATIYRTLKLLVAEGVVQSVDIGGEAPRYEAAGKGHHHHFHCRSCNRVFELEGCCGHFQDLTPAGFSLEGHELTLYGRCEACAAKASSPAKKR